MELHKETETRETSPLSADWQAWRHRHIVGMNARETAYQILRDKITFLELKPGEALNDKLLAEELEMSRTPVREALILLSTTNMVLLRPQRGTFVAPIDTQWVEVEQFSRYAVEKEVLTQAIHRLTPELRKGYEDNLALYEQTERSRDALRNKRLLDLDNSFHRLGFTAAGREDSFFYLLNNMQHIERLRMLSLLELRRDTVLEDHSAISRALLEGDLPAALERLELHMNRYRENLREIQRISPQYFSLELR